MRALLLLLVLALATVAPSAIAAAPCTPLAPGGPAAAEACDLDGDGVPDVVAFALAGAGSGYVVLIRYPDAGFQRTEARAVVATGEASPVGATYAEGEIFCADAATDGDCDTAVASARLVVAAVGVDSTAMLFDTPVSSPTLCAWRAPVASGCYGLPLP